MSPTGNIAHEVKKPGFLTNRKLFRFQTVIKGISGVLPKFQDFDEDVGVCLKKFKLSDGMPNTKKNNLKL